ncbi:phosphotransferase family protein [Saccharibacillus sp. JS10]|uniref:phosphotransferase family protein n=1 Tax=Saccharibacillus sp. JS10 TaxID=2950552 RepID=UPI00210B5B86|nr:aminoglycoside phosphotransferase family protein [Saccharibacillus sp. JS10]MCQ4085525.1 aminoglycoside phosphotransferase family protein [Saccharibacillus sp. JS10]
MNPHNRQLATLIAKDFFAKKDLHMPSVSINPIVGKGFVNEVWVAEAVGKKIIIRMNDEDSRAEKIYLKEKWCIEQASLVGIPSPEILELGVRDEVPYMIQSFKNGVNGLEYEADPCELWRKIGKYASLFHQIPVKGYGEELKDAQRGEFYSPPHPGSDGSWNGYLRYNINSLNDQDKLLELGVITREESRQAQFLFQKLAKKKWEFGLNHGDLSLKNILIDGSFSDHSLHVTLIDWGNAEIGPVPHVDLMQLLLIQMIEGKPDEHEINAFLEGYGLSSAILQETRELFVLRSFDKLRWAIDCSPKDITQFADIARKAFTQAKVS